MPNHRAAVSLLLALATGCATGNVSRADLHAQIQVQYGRVDEVEPVTLESNALGNAVIGGVVGALVGRKNRLAGAAIGAAGAGAVTAVAEGNRAAFAYTVRLESGAVTKIVMDHGDVTVGQCVAVEQGRSANLRVVSPGHCRPEYSAVAATPDVQARAHEHASACDAAKDAVVAATTEAELDLAAKKARVVCGH